MTGSGVEGPSGREPVGTPLLAATGEWEPAGPAEADEDPVPTCSPSMVGYCREGALDGEAVLDTPFRMQPGRPPTRLSPRSRRACARRLQGRSPGGSGWRFEPSQSTLDVGRRVVLRGVVEGFSVEHTPPGAEWCDRGLDIPAKPAARAAAGQVEVERAEARATQEVRWVDHPVTCRPGRGWRADLARDLARPTLDSI